ncbi:hypothetical protein GE09DRAFT_1211682 [Coniochaeta sp. 2T2.1]|nr:hypothetical protein GE09DRAFT_1211682 [Coniochaeta sp. 2T2.1]
MADDDRFIPMRHDAPGLYKGHYRKVWSSGPTSVNNPNRVVWEHADVDRKATAQWRRTMRRRWTGLPLGIGKDTAIAPAAWRHIVKVLDGGKNNLSDRAAHWCRMVTHDPQLPAENTFVDLLQKNLQDPVDSANCRVHFGYRSRRWRILTPRARRPKEKEPSWAIPPLQERLRYLPTRKPEKETRYLDAKATFTARRYVPLAARSGVLTGGKRQRWLKKKKRGEPWGTFVGGESIRMTRVLHAAVGKTPSLRDEYPALAHIRTPTDRELHFRAWYRGASNLILLVQFAQRASQLFSGAWEIKSYGRRTGSIWRAVMGRLDAKRKGKRPGASAGDDDFYAEDGYDDDDSSEAVVGQAQSDIIIKGIGGAVSGPANPDIDAPSDMDDFELTFLEAAEGVEETNIFEDLEISDDSLSDTYFRLDEQELKSHFSQPPDSPPFAQHVQNPPPGASGNLDNAFEDLEDPFTALPDEGQLDELEDPTTAKPLEESSPPHPVVNLPGSPKRPAPEAPGIEDQPPTKKFMADIPASGGYVTYRAPTHATQGPPSAEHTSRAIALPPELSTRPTGWPIMSHTDSSAALTTGSTTTPATDSTTPMSAPPPDSPRTYHKDLPAAQTAEATTSRSSSRAVSPPSQATPSQATPSQATPSQATPSQATPSQATPSQATPSQATPSQSDDSSAGTASQRRASQSEATLSQLGGSSSGAATSSESGGSSTSTASPRRASQSEAILSQPGGKSSGPATPPRETQEDEVHCTPVHSGTDSPQLKSGDQPGNQPGNEPGDQPADRLN